MSLSAARSFFDSVNHAYVAVHQAKEDLFWSTYMAISGDDTAFARAEQAYKNFIADPDRLRETDGASTLDATIRIVHGSDVIVDSTDGEDAMCDRFERWVAQRYAVA